MSRPFIGSEARAAGAVRKHELRSRFRAVFPDVYLPLHEAASPTFRQKAEAAYLWSRREGVISGVTAARLLGAKWVDDESPIELVWRNQRPPTGIRVSAPQLAPGEVRVVNGLPTTTRARTAFDIGRRGSLLEVVCRLDALGAATGLSAVEVTDLAARHPRARGLKLLGQALKLFDPGAQSPRETWLRLLVMKAGFPKPRTQIPVGKYYLDMGWEDLKLAAEYDGDHHRADKKQFAWDITRHEELADAGWTIVRVVAGTKPAEVLDRLRRAWHRRASIESAPRSPNLKK